MNIKQLIKEVESCQYQLKDDNISRGYTSTYANILQGIKQTVEAADDFICDDCITLPIRNRKDWQTLKKLLGIK